ncbi:hypothetical protein JOE66_002952 [Subtercola frigoramans]|uniref:Uncharacterized protein n=1 Tax=Subtercola frigoramans TaxID=120298 RepID=A0ABS2L898_9MICO|nr:hypothetical protein [Subtercola frigoramans]
MLGSRKEDVDEPQGGSPTAAELITSRLYLPVVNKSQLVGDIDEVDEVDDCRLRALNTIRDFENSESSNEG